MAAAERRMPPPPPPHLPAATARLAVVRLLDPSGGRARDHRSARPMMMPHLSERERRRGREEGREGKVIRVENGVEMRSGPAAEGARASVFHLSKGREKRERGGEERGHK